MKKKQPAPELTPMISEEYVIVGIDHAYSKWQSECTSTIVLGNHKTREESRLVFQGEKQMTLGERVKISISYA